MCFFRLIKQNSLLQQQNQEKQKYNQEKDKQPQMLMDEVETRELMVMTTRCDNKDALMLLPNGITGGGGVLALNGDEGQKGINGVAAIEYSSPNDNNHSNRIMDTVQPQLLPLMSTSFTNGLVNGGGGAVDLTLPPVLNVIPAGVEEVISCDSVDGSPSPPLVRTITRPQALTDVMLESVDLRCASSASSSDSHNFAGLSPELGQGKSSLWYGNVETSTDTLVPTNAVLTEEESKHFPGSNSVDLSNFLTKREENEEMRPQRIVESEGVQIPNGIDCSVFGENSFNNMDLLTNQSVYEPSTTSTAVSNHVLMDGVPKSDLHLMDLSLMESAVIQSQPKSRRLQRHRRTPSNSKSEPSPHKFQNGK